MYSPGIPCGDSSEESRPCSISSLRPHNKQTWALAAPCPPLAKQELTCTMPVLFASILTNGLSYALGLSQALCSRGGCVCRNKWEKKAVLLFQKCMLNAPGNAILPLTDYLRADYCGTVFQGRKRDGTSCLSACVF